MQWQDLLDVLQGFARRAAGWVACVAVCGRQHLVVEFTVGDVNFSGGDTNLKIDTGLCK